MKSTTTALLVLFVAIGTPCVHASQPPDARVNLQSGMIEISDPVWAGDNYDIRYVVTSGEMIQASDVTTHPADDLRPRMAIAPNGDAYVVWWRDVATTQVLVRRHNHADGTWSAESVLNSADVPGRNPEIVHDGSDVWVAFVEQAALETIIRVSAIEDSPDPFGVVADVASTDFDGDIDLAIHAASGHLWITWTDSDLDVAWIEYDHASATWSTVDYDSYSADSAKHALERIRTTILGD